MLTSQLGIRLILWMGSPIPQPASAEVMNSLAKVEIINDLDSGDGFQMTFTLGKDKSLEYGLLGSGAFDPFTQVVIGVILGATPEALINGVITHHQISPSNEPGKSTLTVTGKDVSAMMDLEEKNEKYDNQPDFLIVNRLILSYAEYGLLPQATPTTDIPLMIQRIPSQHETDLKFIQRLAKKNGFIFYVEPVTLGVNKAYWGPETRLDLPLPALTLNMGASTNLKTLNFSNDALASVETKGTLLDPITKMSMSIPSLPSLRVPPIASSPSPPRRKVLLRATSNQNPAQAAASALSAVTTAPEPVTGEGELETVRYGSVLRARRLVGVRGVGRSYDGIYYVRRVQHLIARGSYTQKFKLSREGTGSILPAVVV
jgi:hypothetical protein